ncbi:MAG: HAD-IB family phosphatase [Prevotella sp.]
MRKIYAFDFDGTITNCDSLIAIIRYVSGNTKLILWILTHIHLLLLMKAGLYSNNKLKQQLCRHIFAGMTADALSAKANDFARDNSHILRPQAIATIKSALAEGSTVCIISASPSIWVRPFFHSCPGIEFLCTEMETVNGMITGKFIGSNCYGQEKVNRLLSRHPDRDKYELFAFGDSRGDRELLAFADCSHYKPFRS